MRRKLAAGNWKMFGDGAALDELRDLIAAHPRPRCDVMICPPATLIHRAAETARSSAVAIGAQTCHAAMQGAHTGEVSAAMVRDAGASAVIVGHSERRTDHGETDGDIRAQAEAALSQGLTVIVCVGESLAQREAGETLSVVAAQLAGAVPDQASSRQVVIAYEPVWAIGTGLTPTLEQIAEVHGDMRARLIARFGADAEAMRLLYGGSVKPANAAEIFGVENVDGALVGGASLKATDFSPIISALEAAG